MKRITITLIGEIFERNFLNFIQQLYLQKVPLLTFLVFLHDIFQKNVMYACDVISTYFMPLIYDYSRTLLWGQFIV